MFYGVTQHPESSENMRRDSPESTTGDRQGRSSHCSPEYGSLLRHEEAFEVIIVDWRVIEQE